MKNVKKNHSLRGGGIFTGWLFHFGVGGYSPGGQCRAQRDGLLQLRLLQVERPLPLRRAGGDADERQGDEDGDEDEEELERGVLPDVVPGGARWVLNRNVPWRVTGIKVPITHTYLYTMAILGRLKPHKVIFRSFNY